MQFAWFARCVGWWRETRGRVLDALRQSSVWRGARLLRRLWREALRRLATHFR
jgi:hypothetical protein